MVCVGVNYLDFKFLQVNVIFYTALKDAVIAIFLSLLLMKLYYKIKRKKMKDSSYLIVIFSLLGYVYAISVPTVIDRSLSIYVLEKIYYGGGVSLERFREVVESDYLLEYKVTDARLTEQIESGSIVNNNNCITLSPWGSFIASFTSKYRANFLPRKRLLGDKYTSNLTDPISNKDERDDCQ